MGPYLQTTSLIAATLQHCSPGVSSMSRCAGFLAVVVCFLWLVGSPGAAADPKASVEKMDFGKMPDGTAVELFVLTNARGMKAKVITYGGIITELHVPDRDG